MRFKRPLGILCNHRQLKINSVRREWKGPLFYYTEYFPGRAFTSKVLRDVKRIREEKLPWRCDDDKEIKPLTTADFDHKPLLPRQGKSEVNGCPWKRRREPGRLGSATGKNRRQVWVEKKERKKNTWLTKTYKKIHIQSRNCGLTDKTVNLICTHKGQGKFRESCNIMQYLSGLSSLYDPIGFAFNPFVLGRRRREG